MRVTQIFCIQFFIHFFKLIYKYKQILAPELMLVPAKYQRRYKHIKHQGQFAQFQAWTSKRPTTKIRVNLYSRLHRILVHQIASIL